MAGLQDLFQSSAAAAQKISVDNRTSVIRTNRSIITTGRGSTPANIFTLPQDNQRDGGSQADLAQLGANTLNKIPKVVGRCVTGGIVIDKYTIPGSRPQRTQYVLALSHTHIDIPFQDYLIRDTHTPGTALDVRVDGTTPNMGYCVTALESTSSQDQNCWGGNSNNPPEIYRDGKLCVFGSGGRVIGLADPTTFDGGDPEYEPINSNFTVHLYCGWGGLDSKENQIFPRDGTDASSWFLRPGLGTYAGMVFAIIEVIKDDDLDITGLGEWRFGIDNSSNYQPQGQTTRKRRNNPSQILQQYLTDARYGVGLDPAFLDTQSFEDWRVNCELDVFNGTAYGTNPGEWVYWDMDNSSATFVKDRWMATNNAINTSLTVGENIKRITQSGLAQLHWDHEIQRFRVVFTRGIPDLDIDTLFNFNTNNTINTIDITSGDFFNMPTYATVSYPDRRLSSESNSLRLDVSDSDLALNEPENGVSYEFPLINDRARALVMANISLYENRDDEIIEFVGDYTTRDTRIGDYVTVTDANQALDKTIVRLVRITEEVTPDGGLYYRYQAKQYSDKPFQAQTYTDDPLARDREFFGNSQGNLIGEISGTRAQQIRIEQVVVFDTDTQSGYRYDYTYADNQSTVPSQVTSQPTTKANHPEYGTSYMGTSGYQTGRCIGFKIRSNMTYHDTVKVEAHVGDDQYWSPCYASQTYTIPGSINGSDGFTGNSRRIVIGLDKLGQTGTPTQPEQYTWRINSYDSQSYPYNASNVCEVKPNIGVDAGSRPEYTQTGTGMTILSDGEVRITEEPSDIIIDRSDSNPQNSLIYDMALLPKDQYYLKMDADLVINDYWQDTFSQVPLEFPGAWVNLPAYGDANPFAKVTLELQTTYHSNNTIFPEGAGNGDTTRYTDQYESFTRAYRTGILVESDEMYPGKTIPVKIYSPIDVWNGADQFPTEAQLSISGQCIAYWLGESGSDSNDAFPVNATLKNIRYEVSNNSRMREE